MTDTMRMAARVLCLVVLCLSITSLNSRSTEDSGAYQSEARVSSDTSPNIDLLKQFTVKGFLTQQNVEQPGCVAGSNTSRGNINPSLNTCTSEGLMDYDWANQAMYTEYTPCLPLLTPTNGSPQTCSYTFINGNIYYVYTNQAMTEGDITGSPQCCVVEDFPMLSPSFPSYVQEYNQQCNTGAPNNVWTHAQTVSLYQTPGVPPGFYGYYPSAEGGPPGADGHVMPYGFGGKTPKDFSQMSFLTLEANSPGIQKPALCGDSPPSCMLSCADTKEGVKCGKQTISQFLNCLLQPTYGGCALCHTTSSVEPYPETFPTCPGQPQNECPLILPASNS